MKTEEKKAVKKTGLSTKVYGKQGKEIGEVELPKEIFDAKVNKDLMAQFVRVYLANQRQGGASTKTRGEVKGSTRKIYRQKGTGRARHGSIKAPIFVGGGIVFGPRTRDFSLKMPQKMRTKALFSALTLRYKNNQILVLDQIEDIKPKTKEIVAVIKALNLLALKKDRVLLILPKSLENIIKAARNIENLNIEIANTLNTYEVLNNKNLVFLKSSLEVLQNTFLKKEVKK